VQTRSRVELDLKTQVQSDGSLAVIAGENYQDIYGLQMSLAVKGSYRGIRGDQISIGEEDVAYRDGVLHLSYGSEIGQTVEAGDILFVLEGVDGADLTLGGLNAEAYQTADLEVMNIDLEIQELNAGLFLLEQNTPNPWRDLTVIELNVPRDGEIQMIVRDITGKLVMTRYQQVSAGRHSMIVDNKDIAEPGVYTYEIIFGNEKLTRRMIRLR
jgi:hypothetical protein